MIACSKIFPLPQQYAWRNSISGPYFARVLPDLRLEIEIQSTSLTLIRVDQDESVELPYKGLQNIPQSDTSKSSNQSHQQQVLCKYSCIRHMCLSIHCTVGHDPVVTCVNCCVLEYTVDFIQLCICDVTLLERCSHTVQRSCPDLLYYIFQYYSTSIWFSFNH